MTTSRGSQRRIKLGLLFSTTANMAVVNPTTAKNEATSDPNLGLAQNLSDPNFTTSDPNFGIAKRSQFRATERSNKKGKEKEHFSPPYQEYVGRIESDRKIGLNSGNQEILNFNDWLKLNK